MHYVRRPKRACYQKMLPKAYFPRNFRLARPGVYAGNVEIRRPMLRGGIPVSVWTEITFSASGSAAIQLIAMRANLAYL